MTADAVSGLEPADILYVSPHLDDVALSCGGRVLADREAGRRVLVVSLFTEPAHGRRKEERKALAVLDATGFDGRLIDAPDRDPAYRRFAAILFARNPQDAEVAAETAELLVRILEQVQPKEIVGPLGVGGHVDHRNCHQATRDAARRTGTAASFYDDRPYSFVDESVRLRLAELAVSPGDDLPARSWPSSAWRYVRGLLRARFARAMVGPRDLPLTLRATWALVASLRRQQRETARAEVHRFEPDVLPRLRESVACYRSQVGPLFGHLDRWAEQTAEAAAELGVTEGHAERYWRFADDAESENRGEPGA
ncbi:MAG: PIG-L family deacetylase [Acidobacteriota bacterium]